MPLFTVPSLATRRLKSTRDCLLVETLDSCLTGSEWTQAVVLRTLALRFRYGCLPGTRGHTFPRKAQRVTGLERARLPPPGADLRRPSKWLSWQDTEAGASWATSLCPRSNVFVEYTAGHSRLNVAGTSGKLVTGGREGNEIQEPGNTEGRAQQRPKPVSVRHGCYKKHLRNGQMWKVAEWFLKRKLEGGVHSWQCPRGLRQGPPGILQRCREAGTGLGAVGELITKNGMRCRSHCRGAGNVFKKDANPGEELLLVEPGVGVRKPV